MNLKQYDESRWQCNYLKLAMINKRINAYIQGALFKTTKPQNQALPFFSNFFCTQLFNYQKDIQEVYCFYKISFFHSSKVRNGKIIPLARYTMKQWNLILQKNFCESISCRTLLYLVTNWDYTITLALFNNDKIYNH